jgi:tRNA (pseudouridine54-N1)-methyltransferase
MGFNISFVAQRDNIMRRFLIISNTVDTSKPLSLNSLTGYGRLDVLCRCITAAFFLSDKFRKDVILTLFFRKNEKILEIQGSNVRGINPDERAIAGVLKRVFSGKKYPGITFSSKKLKNLLTKFKPYILDDCGETLPQKFDSNNNIFLIGDQLGFLEEDRHLLGKFDKLSLGSYVYLSSQTITILNFLLDNLETKSKG